jgi:hypothetical protein
MNALPSFNPPPSRPKTVTKREPQHQRRRQTNAASLQQRYRRQATESIAKSATYLGLSVFAAIGAVNLINYNSTQQSKLHQLQTELKTASQKSQTLDLDFQRSFDRQSPKVLMQESSYKIDPHTRPIAIVEAEARN